MRDGRRWDPALALGHAEIDRQHEEMFRRFAALVAAMEADAPRDVELLFDFLGEFVASHFAAEERLMAATHTRARRCTQRRTPGSFATTAS